jgi:hypothetical protein
MDKLASFLSNDIVVKSSNISKLYPEMKERIIIQKENVLSYWKKLNQDHFFEMKFLTLEKKDRVITCEISILDGEKKMLAIFTINEYGKFVYMDITYH